MAKVSRNQRTGKPEYVMSIDGYRDGSVDKAVEILNKKGFGIERIGRSLNAPVSGLDIAKKTMHAAPMMSLLETRFGCD